jgi:RimJ/RimL family protein N-acetyltransferase
MTHYRKLIGKKCYLSPPSLQDAEKWTEWDNDLEVTIPMGEEAYTPFSVEKTRAIVEDVIKKQAHCFNIVDLKTNQAIGRCMLFAVDHVDRRAMFGIAIGDKTYWDKGYGQEATGLLLDYGFNLLNLHNIMLGVYSFNQRAINCYRKTGSKEIGKRREARIVCGKKYDVVLMDVLATEFRSVYVQKLMEGQKRKKSGRA